MFAADAGIVCLLDWIHGCGARVGEIIMGFALMNFGVVVAILAYVPSISNPGQWPWRSSRLSLGPIFAVRGGNEFRK